MHDTSRIYELFRPSLDSSPPHSNILCFNHRFHLPASQYAHFFQLRWRHFAFSSCVHSAAPTVGCTMNFHELSTPFLETMQRLLYFILYVSFKCGGITCSHSEFSLELWKASPTLLLGNLCHVTHPRYRNVTRVQCYPAGRPVRRSLVRRGPHFVLPLTSTQGYFRTCILLFYVISRYDIVYVHF